MLTVAARQAGRVGRIPRDEKESVLSEDRPEPRLQKFIRGALRWGLLAFGLGALIIAFALYVPTAEARQCQSRLGARQRDGHRPNRSDYYVADR